jgi:molybdopterin converting factor small subunit
MSIEIIIPQFLQHLTGNVQTLEVRGNTAGECLEHLVIRFPQLNSQIFDKNGKLKKHLDIWTIGEAGNRGGLAQPVSDGDRLLLVTIIAGG